MAEIRIPVTVDLGNSEGKLKSIQNGITGTGESFVKLRTAIKQAKEGLDQALEKFGPFSREAAAAGKALGQLNDRAQKIQQFSAAFDADAKFKAFSGAVQGGVGAMQGIIGAQALFGIESANTLEVLKQVQGAMALSQGINSVLDAKDSFIALGAQIKAAFTSTAGVKKGFDTVASGANVAAETTSIFNEHLLANSAYSLEINKHLGASTKAMQLFGASGALNASIGKSFALSNQGLAASQVGVTGSTTAATASMSAFKMALIATGIGVFVIGLGLLVANWKQIKESVSGVTAEQARYNSLQDEAIKKTSATAAELQSLVRIANDDTQSKAVQNEAIKKYNDLIGDSGLKLSQTNKNTKELTDSTNTYIQSLIAAEIAESYKKEIASTTIKAANAQKELDRQQKNLTETQKNYNNSTADGREILGLAQAGVIQAQGYLTQYTDELTASKNAYDSANAKALTFTNTVAKIPGYLQQQIDKLADLKKKQSEAPTESAARGFDKEIAKTQAIIDSFNKKATLNPKIDETAQQSIDKYKESLRDISALQFEGGIINRFTRISDQIKLSEDQLKSLVTKFNLTSSDPLVKGLIKDIEKLKALIAPIPSLLDKIRQTEPITQLFDVKLKGKVEVPDISGAFKDVKEKTQAQIDDLNASLSSTLSSGLTSGISAVASAIGSAIATGANIWDAAGKALIGGLGDLMQQLGQDLIKANTLIELAKLSFGTGPAGILVGVALVALGAFLKSQFTEKAAAGFADGGYVSGPGSSRSDSIPAMLSNGEYVINAASVSKYGLGFLNRINNGLGFADGGLVSRLMVNSSNISGGEIFGREVPYIASTQISGQDLKLILTRADKRFSNVT
jgi:hypothetical protein